MIPTPEAIVALREGEKSLLLLDRYRAAAVRANTIAPNFKIASRDDDDQATADRAIIKDGIKALDEAVKDRAWIADPILRAMFGTLEEAEKRVKAERDRLRGLLNGRAGVIDEAKKEFVRAEQRRNAEEAEAKRKSDAAAAELARQAQATEAPDAPAPPPAETYVAPAPVQTHSKVGTAKATVKTSPVKCEIAAGDRNEQIREIARHWPHLLVLNEMAAKAEFNALVARGQVEKPSEAGTVIGGIRFYVDLIVSG